MSAITVGSFDVPAASGVGAATDTSGFGPYRTLAIFGDYTGSVSVECAAVDDDALYQAIPETLFNGSSAQVTVYNSAPFLRVRRTGVNGGDTPVVTVAALGNDSSSDTLSAEMDVPTADGPGTSFDNTTGGNVVTVTCGGTVGGVLLFEGSNDDTNYLTLAQFGQGQGNTLVVLLSTFSHYRLRRIFTQDSPPTPVVGISTMALAQGGGGAIPDPLNVNRVNTDTIGDNGAGHVSMAVPLVIPNGITVSFGNGAVSIAGNWNKTAGTFSFGPGAFTVGNGTVTFGTGAVNWGNGTKNIGGQVNLDRLNVNLAAVCGNTLEVDGAAQFQDRLQWFAGGAVPDATDLPTAISSLNALLALFR